MMCPYLEECWGKHWFIIPLGCVEQYIFCKKYHKKRWNLNDSIERKEI